MRAKIHTWYPKPRLWPPHLGATLELFRVGTLPAVPVIKVAPVALAEADGFTYPTSGIPLITAALPGLKTSLGVWKLMDEDNLSMVTATTRRAEHIGLSHEKGSWA